MFHALLIALIVVLSFHSRSRVECRHSCDLAIPFAASMSFRLSSSISCIGVLGRINLGTLGANRVANCLLLRGPFMKEVDMTHR